MDVYADALLAPARPRHHGHTGRGKSPPPTLPSLQNSGDVVVGAASLYSTVQ